MWRRQYIQNPKRIQLETIGDKEIFSGEISAIKPSKAASIFLGTMSALIGFNAAAQSTLPHIPQYLANFTGTELCQDALDHSHYSPNQVDSTKAILQKTSQKIDQLTRPLPPIGDYDNVTKVTELEPSQTKGYAIEKVTLAKRSELIKKLRDLKSEEIPFPKVISYEREGKQVIERLSRERYFARSQRPLQETRTEFERTRKENIVRCAQTNAETAYKRAIEICQKIQEQYPILTPAIQKITQDNIDHPSDLLRECQNLERNAVTEVNKLMNTESGKVTEGPWIRDPTIKLEKPKKGPTYTLPKQRIRTPEEINQENIRRIVEKQEYLQRHTSHSVVALYPTNGKAGKFEVPPEVISNARTEGNIEIIAVTDYEFLKDEGKIIIKGSAGSTRGNIERKTFDGVNARNLESVIPKSIKENPVNEDNQLEVGQYDVTLDRKAMWSAGYQLEKKLGKEPIGVYADYRKGKLTLSTSHSEAKHIKAIAVVVNIKEETKESKIETGWNAPVKTYNQSILEENKVQIDQSYLSQLAIQNHQIETYRTPNQAPAIIRSGATRTLEQEIDWSTPSETYQDSILNPRAPVSINWEYSKELKRSNLETITTDKPIITDTILSYREQQLPPLEIPGTGLYNYIKETITTKTKSLFDKVACFFSSKYELKKAFV